MSRTELHQRALACLLANQPAEKLEFTRRAHADWFGQRLELGEWTPDMELTEPGRPQQPVLVHPRKLVRRSPAHEKGRAALIHAVAHIEFNAINLAWDAVYRFPGMPRDYYSDWIQVAEDEVRHYQALTARLAELGHVYGDFPAHNGLWDVAMRTRYDLLARMALVPRVLEARGLDVTPGMIERLEEVGDSATVEILHMILREEVAHVAAGSRWFRYECERRGLSPESDFFRLLGEYMRGGIRCPLHREARIEAGFSEQELQRLEAMCS